MPFKTQDKSVFLRGYEEKVAITWVVQHLLFRKYSRLHLRELRWLERSRGSIQRSAVSNQEEAFSAQRQQSARAKLKKSAKMRYRRGMYDFAGKTFCPRLRDFGCPDTLIKDVRDVAAAVMCSEGPGRSRNKGLNRLESPGHLKQSR
jgi:hypothetical protein